MNSSLFLFLKNNLNVSNVVRIIFFFTFVFSLYNFNFNALVLSSAAFIATFFPYLINKDNKVDLPIEFKLILAFFVVLTVFFGDFIRFYEIFWWWDSFLHFSSGMLFSFIGFLIIYTFYISGKMKSSHSIIILFSFTLSVATGAIWEIFEYVLDVYFSDIMISKMQVGGIEDTMLDLILDTLGAALVSTLAYFHLRNEKGLRFFKFFIRRFYEKNVKIKPLEKFLKKLNLVNKK